MASLNYLPNRRVVEDGEREGGGSVRGGLYCYVCTRSVPLPCVTCDLFGVTSQADGSRPARTKGFDMWLGRAHNLECATGGDFVTPGTATFDETPSRAGM